MKKLQLRAIVKGRVQKVFFRKHVKKCQESFGDQITGFVRNLSDGSVEIVAVGQKEILNAFLIAIEQKTNFAYIDKIEKSYSEPKENFSGFEIIY